MSLQDISSPLDKNASSDNLPYHRCLVPSIPTDAQHFLYNVTTLFVLPLDTLLALLSITCNSVIVVAVLRTRSLQRPSFLLLCSLSMTDVLWAIYSICKNTVFFTVKDLCPREIRGKAEEFVVLLCLLSTLGNLAMISCDRFLAIKKPWWYRNHVTRSHAIKQITLVWVLLISGIVTSVRYLQSVRLAQRILTNVWYALCILIIICSYVGVLIANAQHRAGLDQYGGHMRSTLKREKKIANTVGLILIVLCFTFLPALIAPLALSRSGYSLDERIPFRPFYSIFVTLNGLLNPLLNFGRNEDVRNAVRILIRCLWCVGGPNQRRAGDSNRCKINLFSFRRKNRVTVVADTGLEPQGSSKSKTMSDPALRTGLAGFDSKDAGEKEIRVGLSR